MFHTLPFLEPVELIAVAFNVYRRFAAWLKRKGLIRLADADESYDREDSLALCLRGSLGIGKVVELTDDGDIELTQDDADEKRFAPRRSPHVGEFGGFSIHAGVTVDEDDRDGREPLLRYCARPALSMERISEFAISAFSDRIPPGGNCACRKGLTRGALINRRRPTRQTKPSHPQAPEPPERGPIVEKQRSASPGSRSEAQGCAICEADACTSSAIAASSATAAAKSRSRAGKTIA